MEQAKVSKKARIINWWLIVVSLLEMLFGLVQLWVGGTWGGDYMGISLFMFIIFFLGFISLIFAVFLFMRKKWAWIASIIILLLVVIILGSEFFSWIGPGGITIFRKIFRNQYDFLHIFYASVILVVPLVTLVLLLLNRRKLLLK